METNKHYTTNLDQDVQQNVITSHYKIDWLIVLPSYINFWGYVPSNEMENLFDLIRDYTM
jgi:hypothetical protein